MMSVAKGRQRAQLNKYIQDILKDECVEKRQAYSFAVYMIERRINIEEDDVFAGKFCGVNVEGILPSLRDEISSLEEKCGKTELLRYIVDAESEGLFCRNAGDHFVPAYDILINDGINAFLTRITNKCKIYKKKVEEECFKSEENNRKLSFYESELIVQKAFHDRINRYFKQAMRMYEKDRRENIGRIAEACNRILQDKQVHFFDAIQLLIFAHEFLISEAGCGSISFGRLDMYLYPYYKKDIDAGYITENEAFDYLVALWKKIADFELSWQNITIGGCDEDGNDCCNELTVMCMKATSIVRGDQPQLSLRITKNTPEYVWDVALNLIKEGMGFPSLFNDSMAIKAKENAGVSESDAKNYCVMGCVELCISGKEYAHTEGARLNWAKILELVLKKINTDSEAEDISTFDKLYALYKRELIKHTEKVCEFIDVASDNYAKEWPVPFASSLMQGTCENGRDLTDNGTIYNNLCINCVGFATTVDSLQAIKELVYDRKEISLKDLCSALYEDNEKFNTISKSMIKCSKYGNDIDEVDSMASDLSEAFCRCLSDYKLVHRTGKIMPGFYTSYFHADFGKHVGNTPDGRDKYSPLSSSLSAMAGRDVNGPLALFNSVSKINMQHFGNGMALDVKFLPAYFAKKENKETLRTAIETYFENGGLEVQINVVDKETLIKAQEHPEDYQNLIVRVSGFSAHFVRLEKNLQDEIINRTANA